MKLRAALAASALAASLGLRRGLAADEAATRKSGIDFSGFLRGALGLGESARCLARALAASGLSCGFANVALGSTRDTREPGVPVADEFEHAAHIVHLNPTELPRLIAQFGQAPLVGRHLVGVWYSELARAPLDWRILSRVFDEIWVASEWSRAQLAPQLRCPVLRFPFPGDQLLWNAGTPAAPLPLALPVESFVFAQAFDFRSGFSRKNPAGALAAYLGAFPEPNARTALLLKSFAGETAPRALAELRAGAGARPDIFVVAGDWSEAEMLALYARADCFISLHRSEGLGLGILAALEHGHWALFTDFSGSTEFRERSGSLPVPFTIVAVKSEHRRYRGGSWAEPDVAVAAQRMRELAFGARAKPLPDAGDKSAAFGVFVRDRLAALAAQSSGRGA